MSDRENPCNICKSSDNCDGCVLDQSWTRRGECQNYDCFCNHSDCGCLLSLDAVCKASTCFEEED